MMSPMVAVKGTARRTLPSNGDSIDPTLIVNPVDNRRASNRASFRSPNADLLCITPLGAGR
jgi:hypothetical protein